MKEHVLDKGYVELLDSMGNDLTVVNAARVSFKKRKEQFDGKDERLINYLARHNHFTPFAQGMVQLHIKMPIFVARQYFKHQIGVTRNEVSRRYVDEPPEYFTPAFLRQTAENKKQGSSEQPVEYSQEFIKDMQEHYYEASKLYHKMIRCGTAPEQARILLPQATYTEFIETGSLAAYARIYHLRSSKDAQQEIQEYAQAIGKIVGSIFPYSWKALTEKENELE